ncbi:uncharacterized protein LOC122203530 [Panthera leo]|uniref:uncharacterized protein LOC122203530 n=1 Tax=Panthera leo TaxID=9689 RepID=UPI001C699A68|nr:uncharacterized protein LOC122203530 [Panthera leo]
MCPSVCNPQVPSCRFLERPLPRFGAVGSEPALRAVTCSHALVLSAAAVPVSFHLRFLTPALNSHADRLILQRIDLLGDSLNGLLPVVTGLNYWPWYGPKPSCAGRVFKRLICSPSSRGIIDHLTTPCCGFEFVWKYPPSATVFYFRIVSFCNWFTCPDSGGQLDGPPPVPLHPAWGHVPSVTSACPVPALTKHQRGSRNLMCTEQPPPTAERPSTPQGTDAPPVKPTGIRSPIPLTDLQPGLLGAALQRSLCASGQSLQKLDTLLTTGHHWRRISECLVSQCSETGGLMWSEPPWSVSLSQEMTSLFCPLDQQAVGWTGGCGLLGTRGQARRRAGVGCQSQMA